MIHMIGSRGSGKTTRLLELALFYGYDILVTNRIMASNIAQIAKEKGYSVQKEQRKGICYKILCPYPKNHPQNTYDGIYILIPAYFDDGGPTLKDPKRMRNIMIDEIDIFLNYLMPGLKGYTLSNPTINSQYLLADNDDSDKALEWRKK